MPVESVWTLAAALFVAALAATLKAADAIRSLKRADQEIESLRKEIDLLKKKHDETVSSSQQKIDHQEAQLRARDTGPREPEVYDD